MYFSFLFFFNYSLTVRFKVHNQSGSRRNCVRLRHVRRRCVQRFYVRTREKKVQVQE